MRKSLVLMLGSMLSVVLFAGCTGQIVSSGNPASLWPKPDPTKMVVSNNGTYGVQYWIFADTDEIPTNEQFWLYVFPFEKTSDGWQRVTDAQVKVDAAMPHHGHGMNIVPKITQLDDGSIGVEGMLFHMPGRWELYFDITRNGVTERAQTEVFLE